MKAKITKITKGNMQIDIEVTYFDKGFSVDRVLSLPEEKFSMLDIDGIEEIVRQEGKRYVVIENKHSEFKKIVNKEIDI